MRGLDLNGVRMRHVSWNHPQPSGIICNHCSHAFSQLAASEFDVGLGQSIDSQCSKSSHPICNIHLPQNRTQPSLGTIADSLTAFLSLQLPLPFAPDFNELGCVTTSSHTLLHRLLFIGRHFL